MTRLVCLLLSSLLPGHGTNQVSGDYVAAVTSHEATLRSSRYTVSNTIDSEASFPLSTLVSDELVGPKFET